jgi:membrane protein implicated in regulation of membrane protease activity
MSSINESILDGMNVFVQNAIKNLEYDKTIQAEITKVVNLDTGEYKVKYNGNIFSAYANDLSY